MPKYVVINTQPTVYQDRDQGVVNGVLVKYRMTDYDEVHEVRVPSMRADLVKAAIGKALEERAAIAALSDDGIE